MSQGSASAPANTTQRTKRAGDNRLRLPSVELTILVAALAVGSVLILWAGRRLGFYYDEWMYLQYRRGGSIDTYLEGHNGHLSVIPIAIYKALFATIGTDHYWPYRVVLLIEHLICCVLLYVLVGRRLGARAALVPVLLLVIMANSADNLLWAFQLDFVGSVAAGLGAWVLLDRPSPRGDRWACVLVAVSIGFSSLGIAVLAGVAVELLLDRRRRRQLWIVVIPGVLYAIWHLGYGSASDIRRDNLSLLTQYLVDSASGAAGAVSGLAISWGGIVLASAIAAVAIARRENTLAPAPSPRFAGVVVTALTFWTLTGLSRGHLGEPAAPRYLYFGGVLLMLAAAWMLPRPRRWGAWMTTTVGILLLAILLANAYRLRDASRYLRGVWEPTRAQLAGLEVAGPSNVDPAFPPTARQPQLAAGTYLAAVTDNGSPTGGLAWLRTAPEISRQQADATLAASEGVTVTPSANGAATSNGNAAPTVETSNAGSATASGSCVVFTPQRTGGTVDLTVRAGEALALTAGRADAAVQVRRFADNYVVTPSAVAAGTTGLLRTVADNAPDSPWRVRLTSRARVRACSVDAS
jgi:hypothetical protein